jgi:flavodoxin I
MKVLIVYDSVYGNTEEIARAIGGAISGDVQVLRAGEAVLAALQSVDLLIVGSPTQGGRATQPVRDFIDRVSPDIKGVNVAAFDTRLSTRWVGVFGYAAGRIASSLKGKGGNLLQPPEGFLVKGTQGPLKGGELERAAAWAKGLGG